MHPDQVDHAWDGHYAAFGESSPIGWRPWPTLVRYIAAALFGAALQASFGRWSSSPITNAVAVPAVASVSDVLPPALYMHKLTFATADPEAASNFAVAYLGGVLKQKNYHACGSIWTVIFPRAFTPTPIDPFAMHFVFNPRKPPHSGMNMTTLGTYMEEVRSHDGFASSGTFDQFMDTHGGLVVESLDPFVAKWRRDGIPFTCRTWCCAEGMLQFPEQCPAESLGRRSGCEVGCYVQIPHGQIVELQCGLDDYYKGRECLTLVEPVVFDMCAGKRQRQS